MSTISKVNTETLLAHVLAPIAETEEQADTKAFRKEINREIYRKWHIEKENLRQETIIGGTIGSRRVETGADTKIVVGECCREL